MQNELRKILQELIDLDRLSYLYYKEISIISAITICEILEDLGIKEIRLSNTILALANSTDVFEEALKTAKKKHVNPRQELQKK